MKKGIDVSKYQGNIDWEKVKNTGIEFAVIRAGYGKFDFQKDEKFEQNYSGAKNAGIPVGAYHYSYAKTVEDARLEAEVFLNWIRGKQFEYPVALDIEEKAQSDKGRQFVSDVIRAFCETVENAGYYVCVYANKYWYDNFIDDDCKKKYDAWVAQWADSNTYAGNYGMWQYSSQGSVDGISGRTDLDEAYKDYPEIMRSKGLNGFSAEEQGNPSGGGTAFTPRMMVALQNTPLYISATAKTPAARKSGTYYIYDGKEINGRYRITSSPQKALKTPIGENVTGFVNKGDIK